MKRSFGLLLCMCLVLSFCTVGALAAEERYSDQNGVSWVYTGGEDKTLTMILDSRQSIENASALLISAEVNGAAVKAVRSNGFDNVVVGHKANEYILIADGIEAIGGSAFYDFNFVKSVSIPASVTEVDFNAFDVLGREINNATVIYGAAGSGSGMWVTAEGAAVVELIDSEWTGSIENCGQGVTLALDESSVWTVTGSCTVKSLRLENGASVRAADGLSLCALVDGEAVELGEGVYENVTLLVTKNGETVYDGLYAQGDAEVVETAESMGASDGMSSSGEMGSGEASGEASDDMGGGPMFSTGDSNCTHGSFAALADVTWSFDTLGVAEVAADADGVTLSALAPGQTTLELTKYFMDGTQETERWSVTVTTP